MLNSAVDEDICVTGFPGIHTLTAPPDGFIRFGSGASEPDRVEIRLDFSALRSVLRLHVG